MGFNSGFKGLNIRRFVFSTISARCCHLCRHLSRREICLSRYFVLYDKPNHSIRRNKT